MIKSGFCMAFFATFVAQITTVYATDEREMVQMPQMMQDHMLSNMRDHLRALEETISAMAAGDYDAGAKIMEERLGMSSMTAHGAAHMAPMMPAAMREFGTSMHQSASRFSLMLQEADLMEAAERAPKLYGGLQAVMENCNSCHQAYRIR